MKTRYAIINIFIGITFLCCLLVESARASGGAGQVAGRRTPWMMMKGMRRRQEELIITKGGIVTSASSMLLSRRGGAGHQSSLLGRVLRTWRRSASPVGKGGLIGRLKRFISALWNGADSRSSSAASASSSSSGKVKSGGAGGEGSTKTQGRIDKHLGKSYRRGNANFRIQKVSESTFVCQVDGRSISLFSLFYSPPCMM